MSDSNDDNNRSGGLRAPLTLKPRTGAVSSGTVKQSFSHGRSKTVVVETKRRRIDAPAPPAAAAPPPPRPSAFDAKPRPQGEAPPPRPAQPASAPGGLNLSPEELRTRQRALEAAREMQERQAAERRIAD